MKKIAVLIEEHFEDSEFSEPYETLKKSGFEPVIIAPEAGKEYSGKYGKSKAKSQKSLNEVKAGEFDGLLIPGGQAPEKLRLHPKAASFVKEFGAQGKPIAAICHGPQLLISADLLRGKKATSYESIAIDVKNAGAHFLDEPVVVDGNLITSRKPADIPQFCAAMVKVFKGEKAAV
ncbi:MAG: type 1 glutamine amidotransferase [Firmicutes bacterium]|nr:type 1 glutamine amidotransferase [Bacillota bacterium]